MIKTRDPVFDIMKGSAILFVIMSHTECPWLSFHAFAYLRSPLFFVVSGYFAKEWFFCDFMKNGAKRLVIPLAFTSAVMLPIAYVLDVLYGTRSFDIALKSIILGTASWPIPLGEVYVLSVGPLWFIWATILVRIYWSLLQKIKIEKLRGSVIFVLAIVAYQTKAYVTLPFSIQASFGALGFFYAGYLIKKNNLLENNMGKKMFTFCLIALVYCVGFSNLDVNLCVYGAFYVVDVLAVVAAFFILHAAITRYKTETKFWSLMNFVGRYSLVALCVHAIDQNILVYWFPFKIWSSFKGPFEIVCAMSLRMIFVVFITFLVSKNKFLCEKIFFIK